MIWLVCVKIVPIEIVPIGSREPWRILIRTAESLEDGWVLQLTASPVRVLRSSIAFGSKYGQHLILRGEREHDGQVHRSE